MVPHTRQILDSASPDEDHRVFLEVMAHAGNIGCYLDSVGQTDSSNLPQGRIGLLRGRSINPHTDSPFLRALLQGRSRRFPLYRSSRMTQQLVNRRHSQYSAKIRKIFHCRLIIINPFVKGLPPEVPEFLAFSKQRFFEVGLEADKFITKNSPRCQGKSFLSFLILVCIIAVTS